MELTAIIHSTSIWVAGGGGWILTGAHNHSQKTSSSTTECQFQSADDGSTPTTMMNTYTDAQQTQMERGGCRDARCVTVRGWEVGASTHVRDMSWVVEPVLPTNKVVARYYTSPRQNESIGAQAPAL